MDVGTVVNLMGVHRSVEVACDDPDCPLIHREGREEGTVGERVHLEDGPREGRGAIVVGREPAREFDQEDRYVLRTFTRVVVTADVADVEKVAPATAKTVAFAEEVKTDG